MCTTIKFASKPENILIAEKFIEDIRAEVNMPNSAYEDIFLALTEAADNAMRHGNKDNEEKTVEICCKLDKHSELLSLIVKDEGPGFDFNNISDPTTAENLQKPGGRGVF
jgi:serine/threonine-protein kinase RsbW